MDYYNSEEAPASWFGTWDQENGDLQAKFGASTAQHAYHVDDFGPTGLLTPLSPARHHSAPPPTVDIDVINGKLLPINDSNGLASFQSPLTPMQTFKYDKLVRELCGLYNSLSHDGNAHKALDELIVEIANMSTEISPEDSRVEGLVVPSKGKFHCPFAGCRKKDAGWPASRDARDHIWIDHLNRRLTCPWNDCGETFGRPYDRDRHVKAHKGLGKKFVCTKCNKIFPRKFNLNRHLTSTICNRPRC